jgi:hypothetical protein
MHSSRLIVPVLAAILALGACSDDNVTSSSSGGKFTLLLTDAPGDLAEAWVKIDNIVLINAEGDRLEIEPDVTDFVNLLDFTNGNMLKIVDVETTPEGFYKEMRVVLGEAYVVLNDGRVFATPGADLPVGVTADDDLKCPSCSSSGYKVKISGDGLEIVGNSTFILDFDVAQSFGHEAGKSGKLVMHPVLRVNATTIRFADVSGTVTLADGAELPECGGQENTVEAFTPVLVMDEARFTGVVDADGAYLIGQLLPGTYDVEFDVTTFENGDKLTFTATPTETSVELAEAESATVDFEITEAVCDEAE